MRPHYFVSLIVAIVLLAFIGLSVRKPVDESIKNIDERIPLGMHASMWSNNNLNTDWSSASPVLPYNFSKFRFNFSGYILGSYLLTPAEKDDTQHLSDLRMLNRCFFIVTLILFAVICSMLGISSVSTIVGLTILTFAPGLVHDSQMARPESFLTLLVCFLIFGLVFSKRIKSVGYTITGIALGIGIATKFTFVLLSLLVLYAIFDSKKDRIKNTVFFVAFTLLGFFLAAPYVVFDFQGFWRGIQSLNIQYSQSHFPHSIFDKSTSFFTQIPFFIKVYGFVFLSPLVMAVYCSRFPGKFKNTAGVLVSLAVVYVIFFVTLCLHSVFFERNFHPLILIMALSCTVIVEMVPRTMWQLVIGVILFAPLIYWTYIINLVQYPSYHTQINNRLDELTKSLHTSTPIDVSLFSKIQSCGLIRQIDYSDKSSNDLRQAYLDQSYRICGSCISKFNALPTSTLHTYLDPSIYILYKPCNWPFEIHSQYKLLESYYFIAPVSAVITESTTWKGTDFYKSKLPGLQVIGSWHESDADVGELLIQLNRGDRLLFRSGPRGNQYMEIIGLESDFMTEAPYAEDWIELVFTSLVLPEKFILRIKDKGRGWGEWSAIAIRN